MERENTYRLFLYKKFLNLQKVPKNKYKNLLFLPAIILPLKSVMKKGNVTYHEEEVVSEDEVIEKKVLQLLSCFA